MTAAEPALYDPEAASPPDELFATYRELRDHHPVYLPADGTFVALTRHADVVEAFNDPTTYSSSFLRNPVHPILAQLDPPRHTAMRKVVLKAFTPSRVARIEHEIRTIARTLLDDLVPRGSCDLATDYAGVIPSTVMGRLVGVPEALIPRCREISDLHMRRITQRDILVPLQMSDELFGELLDERRRSPADDLLGALVTAEVDGRRLTEDELLGFCYLLLIGGNDTTTNWIGNTAGLLAARPDVTRELTDDPSLLPGALEETLRYESPTQIMIRRATRDVEVHGTPIAGGSRVLLVVGAANRDEREFPRGEQLDVHRTSGRHLALGQGIHFCLGAALARLEARIAFEELLARVPTFEPDAPATRVRSSWALGYAHLPVRW